MQRKRKDNWTSVNSSKLHRFDIKNLAFTLLPIFNGDSVMRIVQIAEAYSTQWAAEGFDIFQNIQYHFFLTFIKK